MKDLWVSNRIMVLSSVFGLMAQLRLNNRYHVDLHVSLSHRG